MSPAPFGPTFMTRTGSFCIGAGIPLVEGIRQTYDRYPANQDRLREV